MAKPILDDQLWEIIEPVLPAAKKRRKKYPGRKPLDHRKTLAGIIFVLRTGLPWEYLPKELGFGSGMTCWRRLRDWQKKGIWKELHKVLLEHFTPPIKSTGRELLWIRLRYAQFLGGAKRGKARLTAGRKAPSTMWSRTPKEFRWQRS